MGGETWWNATVLRRRSREHLARLYIIACLLLFPWHAQACGDRSMNTNSDTIMLQWHSAGGRSNSLPAMADVTVFTNGRVEIGPRFAHGTVTSHQLSDAELAALRRFVFEEQDIWSIDSAALTRDVTAAANADADAGSRAMPVHPLGPEAVADAATTVLRVHDGERTHQVSQYNLFDAARRYPQIQALQRLQAIERRLLVLAQDVAASAR